jgi:hypothetical protein
VRDLVADCILYLWQVLRGWKCRPGTRDKSRVCAREISRAQEGSAKIVGTALPPDDRRDGRATQVSRKGNEREKEHLINERMNDEQGWRRATLGTERSDTEHRGWGTRTRDTDHVLFHRPSRKL